MTLRKDELLRSINERLGALCDRLHTRAAGADAPPLTTDYLDELKLFALADVEDMQEGGPENDER